MDKIEKRNRCGVEGDCMCEDFKEQRDTCKHFDNGEYAGFFVCANIEEKEQHSIVCANPKAREEAGAKCIN